MNLNGAPELPILDAAAALKAYLNQTQGASSGGGGLETAHEITDPGDGGTIDVANSGFLGLTHTTGNENRTLPDPTFLGQEIVIYLDQDLDAYGGQITVLADNSIAIGDTNAFVDAVGQCIIYYAVQIGGNLRWRIERAVNNAPTLE